nr:FGGY-family carbohydrate kinase [Candidatus Njordarchaeum guaymaensis]
MTSGNFLVGTDIGTFGTKSVLVNAEGKILAESFVETDIMSPKFLWAEQWPEVWMNAVCDTLRSVVSKSKVDPGEIAGLSISGLYSGSGIPVDKDMKPIRPCLIWMDRRAIEEVEWVRKEIGEDEVFRVSGNAVDTYFGFTKMLWLRFKEPKIWRKIRQLMTIYGYCTYRLTDEVCIDYSSAGVIGGIFDIHKKEWSETMMDEMAIPRSFFPERIRESKTVIGEITEDGSKLSGLKKGTPVCAGGVDAPVSALTLGCLDDGDHSTMVGTSTCWSVIQDKLRLTPKLVNFPHVAYDKEKIYTFGGSATSGGMLRWFRDQFGQIEVLLGKQVGLSPYKVLDVEAEGIGPGSDGLVVLPYFMGERSPIWDPRAKGLIVGLTLSHTRAHIFKALMESAAYALRHNVETARKSDIPLKPTMGLVDGGARSRVWRKIFADVTKYPQVFMANSPGTPVGDAFLSGVGTGVIKDYESIKEWIAATEVQNPDLENAKIYDKYYELYLKLYESNKGIFDHLYSIG